MHQIVNAIDNWTLVQVVGGLSIVISAVVGYLAGTVRDYLGHRWRASREKDLESLKHRFNKAEALISTMASTSSGAYLGANRRRLDHLQKLWKGMLSIRNGYPSLAFMAYSVLTRDEVVHLPTTTNTGLRAQIASFDPSKYIDYQFGIVSDVEASRPFVGQRAWNAFFAYQAFNGRLVYLLQDGLVKGQVVYWIDDRNFLNQVLGISIPPESLKSLLLQETLAFHNVRNFLELEVVAEVEAQISGTAAMKETVKQAQQLTQAMGALSHDAGGT
jgi:hypothetical protein